MLKKRIIPCLDVQNGRTVKGINFKQLEEVGDAVALAERYSREGADELVFLDISASIEKRKTLLALVERVAERINIPFTVGGGISSLEDVALLLQAGADKISINSSALTRPELITELAERFGSQCVVVAIDAQYDQSNWKVYSHGGRRNTERNALIWASEAVDRGAGELLVTSMSQDGTKAGFDLALHHALDQVVSVPIIASGGAGKASHFSQLFKETQATGALAASIFHYEETSIGALKSFLRKQEIPVR